MTRLFSLILFIFVGPASAAEPVLKVGLAVADITPPVGYRMAGSYTEKLATGVHDPLFAKALYLEQGTHAAVLIVCDVCGLERAIVKQVRERIARELSIPTVAVSVSATHTHGGPMHYDPIFVPLFAEQAKGAGRPDVHTLDNYPTKFQDGIVQAAKGAKANARETKLKVGTGQAPGTAFNRRYLLKDGTTKMNPGKLNLAIVRAAGPVDEELPVVLFHDAKTGKPFGSFCSFAMHVAVYGGDTFSADYPGHLQRELRKVYGADFISVFAEGCAGDVNHVDVRTRDKDPSPEQLGQKLAAAITAVKWAESGEPKLRFSTTTVAAKLRADRAQDVAISKNRLIGELAKKAGFLEQVEAYRVLLVNQMHVETGPTRPLPVQAFALDNDTAIVTLPHEVFVEHGLEIRKRSPYKHTVIVTIANEVDCYVPTRMAFTEGSYEVTNSPYEPGVGEQLVGAALKLLTELQQPIAPN